MRFLPLLIVFTLLPTLKVVGQDTQDWIQFDQPYIRIPVVDNGWYRISAEDLKTLGVVIDSLSPDCIQLFRRGQEVAIQVGSKNDVVESIEFYGEKNDGTRDSALYTTPDAMPHSYYSLYSDTAAYFLTWNTAHIAGKRISTQTVSTADTGIFYHQEKHLQVYTDEYPAGNLYPMGAGYENGTALSTYDVGEGWTGKTITGGNWHSLNFPIQNRAVTPAPIQLELLVVGRNAGQHKTEIWVGNTKGPQRKLGELTWQNYTTKTFTTTLSPTDITSDSLLTFWLKPTITNERISVSYAQLTYPQDIKLLKNPEQQFFNLEQKKAYSFSSLEGHTYYDITNPNSPKLVALSNSAYHQFDTTEKLLAVEKTKQPVGLKLIRFQKINPQHIDYLIITHPSVRKSPNSTDPVDDYAAYRSSEKGGNFKPLVISSNEVFDQFNYGEPGPLGIRNLIRWLTNEGKLRYVFLIGTSRDPQTVRKLPNARLLDQIPSMGWPGSDITLAMFTNNKNISVPVGRLFASSPSDVSNYLEKVRQHESAPPTAPWRKQVLHVSGGRSVAELNFFRDFILQLKQKWDSTEVGAVVTSLSKQTDLPVESVPIAPLVNQGLSLITVIGHSGLGVTDVDLGLVSDPTYGYSNQGRYPAVIVNGCAVGNYYYGPTPLSTNWITTPKKGAILFLSHTHNGLTNSMKRYTSTIYEVLADPQFTSQGFGTIQQEAIRRFLGENYSLSDLITAQQMNLQGDPAIKLFPAQLPDYSWSNNTFTITDEAGASPTTGSKQLTIKATLTNYGRYFKDSLLIRFRRKKNNDIIQELDFSYQAPLLTGEFSQTFPLSNITSGKENWELIIDPQNAIQEETKTNNSTTREIHLASDKAIPYLPISGSVVSKTEVELVALLPRNEAEQQVIFQWSKDPDFSNAFTDTVSAQGIAAFKLLSLPPQDTTRYYWRVTSPAGNFSNTYSFRFQSDALVSELPEGIAFISSDTLNGEVHNPQFYFQNLTTTRFSDSIEVLLTSYSTFDLHQQKVKIPAIAPKETYSFQLPDNIVQGAGDYRVTVNFNSSHLPEISYENNSCEATFQISADQIPPTLDVLIDNRRLSFNETISRKSVIEVRLRDNDALPISPTSLVTIQLVCPTCPEQLIPVRWEFSSPTTLLLYANLPSNLPNGTYKLVVSGQDRSGNKAATYSIQFRLTDKSLLTEVKVFPNPAQTWFHFGVELEGEAIPKDLLVTIFDIKGILVKRITQHLHTGKNELFWFPTQLSSGIYYYRMEFQNSPTSWLEAENAPKSLVGKIIWKP